MFIRMKSEIKAGGSLHELWFHIVAGKTVRTFESCGAFRPGAPDTGPHRQ